MVTFLMSEKPVDYLVAMAAMEAQVDAIIDGAASERVWLLEHPPLYTAGTSATPDGVRQSPPPPTLPPTGGGGALSPVQTEFPIYETGRGGQYTYHGPGQRVAYVMLDLRRLYPEPDLKGFIHDLEQWIINTLQVFNIKGERRMGRVGIWVIDQATGEEAKIAAIGIRVRRGVAFHGISINVNPDLTHYNAIVPCGIAEYGVTSFEKLGVDATIADLDQALTAQFGTVFGRAERKNADTHSIAV